MERISFSNSSDHGLVAFLVKQYNSVDNAPVLGRTILQKLCYLAKARGVPFSLNFEMHHYGPFCADLFSITDDLIADGIISDHGDDKSSFRYAPGPACQSLLKKQQTVLKRERSKLNNVVAFFRDMPPSELELITTIHYIYCSEKILRSPKKDSVINTVFEIKKGKFTRDTVKSRFESLDKAGLLTWSPKVTH
jgi:uncharacterized protein YwgA